MLISQKCRYVLSAIVGPAMRNGQGSVNIAKIAEAPANPPRFVETVFGQLGQAGAVTSQRGNKGGCLLNCSPGDDTIYAGVSMASRITEWQGGIGFDQ